jgi:hypothetical protein
MEPPMTRWSASLVPSVVVGAVLGCSTDDVVGRRVVDHADASAGSDARAPGAGDGSAAGGHDASIVADAAAGGAPAFQRDGALPVETADAHVPETGTPFHGTLNGRSIDVVDGYSVVYSDEELAFIRIATVNFDDACAAQLEMVRSGTFHQSSAGAYLAVAVTGSEVPPGAYKVNASSITSPFLTQPEPTVYAGFASNDDQCVERHTDALFGTVVIEHVDDRHVTGAFDVTFAKGHMSGAFDAPRCDALVNPLQYDGGTADAGVPVCVP